MTFNILEYADQVITETGETRRALCESAYGKGKISEAHLNSPAPLVVYYYDQVFPPVFAIIQRWFADGRFDDQEVQEMRALLQKSDAEIAVKIPQIADDPERIAEYRHSVIQNYQAEFNQLNALGIWQYIERYADTLEAPTRIARKQALKLFERMVNRMTLNAIGDTENDYSVLIRFRIRGDGDEIYRQ